MYLIVVLIVKQEIYHFFSLILGVITISIAIFVGLAQISINKQLTDLQTTALLRPVILRSENSDWEKLSPLSEKDYKNLNELQKKHLLEFVVLKNIAKDLRGEIVKDGYKYKLHFFDDITQAEKHKIECEPKWGWTKPDDKIYAIFSDLDKVKTSARNCIKLRYKDIAGNNYLTTEGKFSVCASQN